MLPGKMVLELPYVVAWVPVGRGAAEYRGWVPRIGTETPLQMAFSAVGQQTRG